MFVLTKKKLFLETKHQVMHIKFRANLLHTLCFSISFIWPHIQLMVYSVSEKTTRELTEKCQSCEGYRAPQNTVLRMMKICSETSLNINAKSSSWLPQRGNQVCPNRIMNILQEQERVHSDVLFLFCCSFLPWILALIFSLTNYDSATQSPAQGSQFCKPFLTLTKLSSEWKKPPSSTPLLCSSATMIP